MSSLWSTGQLIEQVLFWTLRWGSPMRSSSYPANLRVALMFCLSLGALHLASAQSTEQATMQECAAQAERALLQGDARKNFMRECMPSIRATFNTQREVLSTAEREVSTALANALASFRIGDEQLNEAHLLRAQEQWQNYILAHCQFEESLPNGGKLQDERRRVECLVRESNRRSNYLRGLAK
ncbi:Phosphate-starvation-induced PsiF repeat [Comamonadaceae bacterium]